MVSHYDDILIILGLVVVIPLVVLTAYWSLRNVRKHRKHRHRRRRKIDLGPRTAGNAPLDGPGPAAPA